MITLPDMYVQYVCCHPTRFDFFFPGLYVSLLFTPASVALPDVHVLYACVMPSSCHVCTVYVWCRHVCMCALTLLFLTFMWFFLTCMYMRSYLIICDFLTCMCLRSHLTFSCHVCICAMIRSCVCDLHCYPCSYYMVVLAHIPAVITICVIVLTCPGSFCCPSGIHIALLLL